MSKITNIILKKIAVRGAIALATSGAGLLVIEGIASAIDAMTIAEAIGEAIEITEIAQNTVERTEMAQMATEMAELTDVPEMADAANTFAEELETLAESADTPDTPDISDTPDAPDTPDTLEIPDWFKSTAFAAISLSVFKVDIHWNKFNIQLNNKVRDTIQKKKKEKIKDINKIKQKIQQTQNQEEKESFIRILDSKVDSLSKSIFEDKETINSIVKLILATYISVQGSAVGNMIEAIEQNNPSIYSTINSNPELVVNILSQDENFQKFEQDVNTKINQEVIQGIKKSILEEIKDYPVKFAFAEIELSFECYGKNNDNIIVKAFKNTQECILHLEGLNSEKVETPEVIMKYGNYPDSLISDIFHMCRCYREYKRLDSQYYAQDYTYLKQKTLDSWQNFRNI